MASSSYYDEKLTSTVAFTSLLGIAMWGEWLDPWEWVGLGLIVASGVMATSRPHRPAGSDRGWLLERAKHVLDFHVCGFSPRFSHASGSRGTNHRLQAPRPSGSGSIRRKAFQAGGYPSPEMLSVLAGHSLSFIGINLTMSRRCGLQSVLGDPLHRNPRRTTLKFAGRLPASRHRHINRLSAYRAVFPIPCAEPTNSAQP